MPKGLVRYHHSGQFHFITFSCHKRLPLLDSAHAYTTFEQELEQVRQRYGFVVAGYVLMPEHVHLLTNEPPVSTLSIVLQALKQELEHGVYLSIPIRPKYHVTHSKENTYIFIPICLPKYAQSA